MINLAALAKITPEKYLTRNVRVVFDSDQRLIQVGGHRIDEISDTGLMAKTRIRPASASGSVARWRGGNLRGIRFDLH